MPILSCRLRGERALFRDISVAGADVSADEIRPRAIKGIIGNVLGLWRDFSALDEIEETPVVEEWWKRADAEIIDSAISFSHRVVIGQHRYKTLNQFMKPGESGPKPLEYLWDVEVRWGLRLNEEGAAELQARWRCPIGMIYLGQSNCPAQLLPLEISAVEHR